MKLGRYSYTLVAILAVCVASLFLASSAHAQGVSRTTTTVSVSTGYLVVNCKQKASAEILQNWAKYGICGYGNSTRSTVTPYGTSTGACGTVSNSVSNAGGGNARSTVTITAVALSGGMSKAFYAGGWQNRSTNSDGSVSDINGWPIIPSFSWTDLLTIHTDTGSVNIFIDSESATTLFFGECTLASPISASAQITV